ncbi:phage head-tail connector protein [Cohnella sp. GCM10020058]|uniref:phage head-tail connector protein n=1 Tax=Cohnella sp. GCM10020058 TaxID=3317330 RepID=UPI00362CCAB8
MATSLDRLMGTLGLSEDIDGSLGVLLDDVESDLLSWTNRRTLPPGLEPTKRQIAIMRYNKVGIEGETSHSEGGVSRSFEDLPESVKMTIGSYRLLKVARYATP